MGDVSEPMSRADVLRKVDVFRFAFTYGLGSIKLCYLKRERD